MRALGATALLAAAGCGGDARMPGAPDASVPVDATGDSGQVDASALDAAPQDATSASDGSPPSDCSAAPHCISATFTITRTTSPGGPFEVFVGVPATYVGTFSEINEIARQPTNFRIVAYAEPLTSSFTGVVGSVIDLLLTDTSAGFVLLTTASGPALDVFAIDMTDSDGATYTFALGTVCPISVTEDADGYPRFEPFVVECEAVFTRSEGGRMEQASGSAMIEFR